ncbi:hypothetical protein CYY_002253 [Polysphondylium violaceum]|uniref:UDENN FNIP1/2-type domain-containing protein n=1 Tax=Polysphondylium violaceum TaxID=133409 RepID=A0A8J4PZG6_9MYCE|nr:hypothetical protein CYY_002253 [Polysphondylium violaceum]
MDFFKFFTKDTSQDEKKEEFDLANDQIRFVVYQNSSTLLFDTLQADYLKNRAKTAGANGNVAHKSTGQAPQQQRPVNGKPSPSQSQLPRIGKIDMLREMMFGTVPLNIAGTTTKIHYLPDSQQLLMTKLFTLNLKRDEKKSASNTPAASSAASASTAPPSPTMISETHSDQQHQQQPQHNSMNLDKSIGSTTSTNSNVSSASGLVHSASTTDLMSKEKSSLTSSTNSAQTTTTSTPTNHNLTPTKESTNRLRSSSTLANQSPRSPLSQPRVTKLTVAVCVIFGPKLEILKTIASKEGTAANSSSSGSNPNGANKNTGNSNHHNNIAVSNFHQFIITHFLIIDMRIKFIVKLLKNQLYSKFTSNGGSGSIGGGGGSQTFGIAEITQLYSEVEKFRQYIKDFYHAPRLEKPLWLDTLTSPSTKRQTFTILLENLRELLPIYNTPKSRFFLSNIITSILSYNLSWLTLSLAANEMTPSLRCNSESCNSEYSYQNQFLYQLSQIYGYTGCVQPACKNNHNRSNKLTKFILVSPKEDISKKFLQVISYFWRTFELIINKNYLKSFEDSSIHLYQEYEYNVNFSNGSSNSSGSTSNLNNSSSSNNVPHQPPISHHLHLNNRLHNHFKDTSNQHHQHQHQQHQQQYNIGSQNLNLPNYFFDLSRSLTGSFSNKYISDFCMMALPKDDFYPKLINDLRLWIDHHPFKSPIKESSAIVADLTKCKCDIIVCSKENVWNATNPVQIHGVSYPDVSVSSGIHSEYISSTLSSVIYFWTMGMPPEACIMYLEDKLRELFSKAVVFTDTCRYYQLIKQPIPASFNVFSNTTDSSHIPIPASLLTPLATPRHSPQSSVSNFSTIINRTPVSAPNGDYQLLEQILYFTNNL